jgi:hypothetical protein
MGITGEYYRKSAGNSVRDRPAPATFDPRFGSRGRFPLMSLRLRATLARATKGDDPACKNSPARRSETFLRGSAC